MNWLKKQFAVAKKEPAGDAGDAQAAEGAAAAKEKANKKDEGAAAPAASGAEAPAASVPAPPAAEAKGGKLGSRKAQPVIDDYSAGYLLERYERALGAVKENNRKLIHRGQEAEAEARRVLPPLSSVHQGWDAVERELALLPQVRSMLAEVHARMLIVMERSRQLDDLYQKRYEAAQAERRGRWGGEQLAVLGRIEKKEAERVAAMQRELERRREQVARLRRNKEDRAAVAVAEKARQQYDEAFKKQLASWGKDASASAGGDAPLDQSIVSEDAGVDASMDAGNDDSVLTVAESLAQSLANISIDQEENFELDNFLADVDSDAEQEADAPAEVGAGERGAEGEEAEGEEAEGEEAEGEEVEGEDEDDEEDETPDTPASEETPDSPASEETPEAPETPASSGKGKGKGKKKKKKNKK